MTITATVKQTKISEISSWHTKDGTLQKRRTKFLTTEDIKLGVCVCLFVCSFMDGRPANAKCV